MQQHGKGTNGEQISFTHLKGPSGMKPKDNNMQIHVTKTLFLDYSTLSNERILRYPVSVMGQIIIGSSDRSKSIYGVFKIRSRMLFVCFSTFSWKLLLHIFCIFVCRCVDFSGRKIRAHALCLVFTNLCPAPRTLHRTE